MQSFENELIKWEYKAETPQTELKLNNKRNLFINVSNFKNEDSLLNLDLSES